MGNPAPFVFEKSRRLLALLFFLPVEVRWGPNGMEKLVGQALDSGHKW